MKRAWIVLAVIVVLVAGIAALLLSLDVNQFKPQIVAQLQKSLNRPVSLGLISLKLFPPALAVDAVTVGESPALRSPRPFVTARQIRVRAGLFALLRKQIDIDSVILDQPAIELIKSPKGTWNFSDIGGQSTGGGQAVGLDKFEIVDGTLAVTDQTRAVYNHIDLTLAGYAPGRKFDLDAALNLPGGGKASLKGSGGPLPSTAFTGKASLSDARLSALKGLFDAAKLDADAVLSGDAMLVASGDATNIDGDLKATDVRFGATKLPNPIEAEYRIVDNSRLKTTQISKLQVKSGDGLLTAVLTVAAAGVSGSGTIQNLPVPLDGFTEPLRVQSAAFQLSPGAARIENLRASLAKSNLTGSVSVRNFSAPNLQFSAAVDQLDLAEIQKVTAAPASASGAKSEPSAVTGAGSIQIGALRYNNLLLSDAKATCTLDHGLIRLDPLGANTSGGHVTGDIQYDGRHQPARIAVNTTLDKIQANELLSATTSLKDTLAGLLSGDTRVEFTSRPGEDVAKSLNGTVRFLLTDGKLQRVNMLNELARIGKFFGLVQNPQSFTPFVKLAGTFAMRDGVATTDDLKLELDSGSMAAAGWVNLADQTVNLKLTAVLNKELAQKAGGNQIAGLMSTVLANPKGELVIPAIVTGSMAQPKFAPDGERFVQMKLKNLLPSTANPAAGAAQQVQGIFDALRPRKPAEGEAAAPAPAPEDKGAAGSLLDLFRKKKETPPPQK